MCSGIWERALARERNLSFARQDALTHSTRSADPRLNAVGYGSHAGYADVERRRHASRRAWLVNDHRVAAVGDLVELFDVGVAEAYAAVGDGLAEFVRLVGAVDAVAVAHFQALLAEHFVVVALLRVDGRDHHRFAGHDRFARLQFALTAVRRNFYDRIALLL